MIWLVAALLAQDGWKAVQDAVDRGEAARAELGKSGDFYAQAALAEIDTLAELKAKPLPRSVAAQGPAREVGAALFKSAGLVVDVLPETRVAIPAGLPFWEAAEELARQLGGDFESPGERHAAWRLTQPRAARPAFASGRVRARITQISTWSFHGLGVPASRSIGLSGMLEGLLAFPDPAFGGHLRVLEAVDERGRAVEGNGALQADENTRSRWGPFQASFTLPEDAPEKLARLRLACDFLFKGAEEPVEITGFLGATDLKKTFGEVEVTVIRAERRERDFKLALNFKAPGMGKRIDFESVAVTDAQGRRWESGGGGRGHGGDSAHFDYEYTPPAEDAVPVKIAFRLVTKTKKHSVFLEFKDLPLR